MRRRCSIPSGGRDKARLAVLPAKRPTIPKDNASCLHSDQARRHSKWLCSWTFPLDAHALPASLTLGKSCRFVFLATSSRGTSQLKWGFIPIRIFYRSEEHTSELQSLMRISYAVFCLNIQIYKCYTHI